MQPALATVVRPSDEDVSVAMGVLTGQGGMTAVELAQVAALMWRCRLETGENLFVGGEVANALYLVADGLVRVETNSAAGDVTAIIALRPGEVVGEAALIGQGEYAHTAVAATQVTALVLERKEYLKLEQQVPSAALKLLSFLVTQLARRERQWLGKIALTASHTLGIAPVAEEAQEAQAPSAIGRLFGRLVGGKELP